MKKYIIFFLLAWVLLAGCCALPVAWSVASQSILQRRLKEPARYEAVLDAARELLADVKKQGLLHKDYEAGAPEVAKLARALSPVDFVHVSIHSWNENGQWMVIEFNQRLLYEINAVPGGNITILLAGEWAERTVLKVVPCLPPENEKKS